MPASLIAVSAVEHPELDEWVREQAADEASRSGVQLGEYLGREDWLGEQQPPDLCCHLFTIIGQEWLR